MTDGAMMLCYVSLSQDKDLKQYLDDCGNSIHMHNVKVKSGASGVSLKCWVFFQLVPV